MKKYVLLVLLSFLLISNKSSAQASLGISQYAYTIYNDTVTANTFDSISIFVINKGTANFNDTFEIVTSVQNSGFLPGFHRVDTASTFSTVFIAAGDSVSFNLYPYYFIGDTTYQYHYDINVIVIWPVASSASTEDSLLYNIVIVLPESVQEINLSHLISAYPNPVINNITLENKGKNSIEEVRIYDAQGRLIEHLTKPEFICTEGWAKGTYLINIQLEDGKTHTIRVVKQ